MTTFTKTVLLGKQAGKTILTGNLRGQECVQLLRSKELSVNPRAQRSLVPGVNKEPTEDLIENDRVLKMPRMKSFLRFVNRVIDNLEHDNVHEGFFGAVQFVLPEKFRKARMQLCESTSLPAEAQVGVFRADPSMGESIFHVADGQARIVGFHSLERELSLKVARLKDVVKKLERKNQSAVQEKEELAEAQKTLDRARNFLSTNDISFVCYTKEVKQDGTVVGLDEDAEKRCYIEGNALNSQASKEDMLKYEQFSPIVVELQARRDEFDWMSDLCIEEDSKSISSSSMKLFTLSALVQAYSWGIVNDNKPLKNIDMTLQATVDERKAFCAAFWAKITELFGPIWLEEIQGEPGDRAVYLRQARQIERNVVFQAIFLQALGRLCYVMGKEAKWEPTSPLLLKIDQLTPSLVEYRVVKKHHLDAEGSVHVDDWNMEWVNAMMKRSTEKGYSFNNAAENINATRHLLAAKIGIKDDDASEETDTGVREAA